MCALSLVICCGLAWWQWERYSSAGGTFQNLGYVLQWPLFGLFPVFMVWRIRRLKSQAAAGEQDEREREPEGDRASWGRRPADVPAPRPAPQAPGAGDAEDPEDAELAAYNRYLAELNARDHEVK